MKRIVTPVLVIAAMAGMALTALADNTYQSLPFSQNWSNVGLITLDDNWSGVPGIIGYRGDNATAGSGVDPQTITFDDTPANTGVATSPVVDVNANKVAADFATFFSGGVTEWELTNPVVALNGSGTGDNPYLTFHIKSTGFINISVNYNLRDIEDFGTDNSIQAFALQFRTSTSGAWTNVPAGFVADASAGPALPLVTPVSVVLPAAANDQATLQIRVMTTNALGSDEWVGPDDIVITGTEKDPPCVTIFDEAVVEGNSGKHMMNLKVSLGRASTQTITVHYETVDFTAKTSDVPPDYAFASGNLTFPPNSTLPQYVPVSIFGDTKNGEGDETFLVNLTAPRGGVAICDGQGVGKILDDDGPTATLVSQFAVEAVEEGISLRWQFGDPSSIKSSKVERADAQTGPWAAVEAEVLTDGGMLTMVDRSVEAEHTYYYRLAAQLNNGQMLTSGFIAATSGNIVREFALSRISPNPTNGPASIDFAVPQQSKVRLSVLDVQGRVVAVLVDGVVKAGRHQAVWNGNGTHGTTRAGMYFVRYEAGGKSFVKRVALTQ